MKRTLFLLVAMLVMAMGANAQGKPMKIVTGHPDFKLKVTRCAASGKTVVLDMLIENVGDSDVDEFKVHGSDYATKVYDDQGNIYDTGISVKIANKQYTESFHAIKLVSDVPTKFSLMIENVSPQAERLVLVEPDIHVEYWKVTWETVKIRNIPITRD